MSQFNKPAHLLVATTLCIVSILPVAAQAHGKRNDATKVTDAVTLPPRKVAHTAKKDGHKALHGTKKAGESVEHGIGRLGKKIF